MALDQRKAWWTCDQSQEEITGPRYYFAPTNATMGPYTQQRHVDAIIDVAGDGTLAGVELVHGDIPPPPPQPNTPTTDKSGEADKYRDALERIALLDEADGHELKEKHTFEAVAIATTALDKHPSEILIARARAALAERGA